MRYQPIGHQGRSKDSVLWRLQKKCNFVLSKLHYIAFSKDYHNKKNRNMHYFKHTLPTQNNTFYKNRNA